MNRALKATLPITIIVAFAACRLVAGIQDLQLTDSGTTSTEGGTCADTTQDSENCGACGHRCLGGACKAGVCQPALVFARAGDVAHRLIVDGPDLFAAFSTGVFRCATTGCGTTPTALYTVPMLSNATVLDLALDQANVYFLLDPTIPDDGSVTPNNDGGLWFVTRAGKTAKPLSLGSLGPKSLALTGATLYWTDTGDPNAGNITSSLFSCPTLGCPKPTVVATASTLVGAVVADSQNVYFTSDATLPDGGIVGTLASCGVGKTCGSKPTLHYTGSLVDSAGAIVYDGKTFYATSVANTIGSIDSAGIGKLLAAGQPAPGIAVDGQFVYFTRNDTGTINRLPIAGGVAPTILSTGQSSPTEITTDATAIYWSNDGDGTVMRLAK